MSLGAIALIFSGVAIILCLLLLTLVKGIRVILSELASRQREFAQQMTDISETNEKFKQFLKFEGDFDPFAVTGRERHQQMTGALNQLQTGAQDYTGAEQ